MTSPTTSTNADGDSAPGTTPDTTPPSERHGGAFGDGGYGSYGAGGKAEDQAKPADAAPDTGRSGAVTDARPEGDMEVASTSAALGGPTPDGNDMNGSAASSPAPQTGTGSVSDAAKKHSSGSGSGSGSGSATAAGSGSDSGTADTSIGGSAGQPS